VIHYLESGGIGPPSEFGPGALKASRVWNLWIPSLISGQIAFTRDRDIVTIGDTKAVRQTPMLLGMEGLLGRDGLADREEELLGLLPPYQDHKICLSNSRRPPSLLNQRESSEDRTLATLALGIHVRRVHRYSWWHGKNQRHQQVLERGLIDRANPTCLSG
jgi:hypothetical protein